MGDRAWTSIEFSGEISEQQAAELVEHLNNQACLSNLHDKAPTVEGLKEFGHDTFYDEECDYAEMSTIEPWCTMNRVSYLKTWAAGGDYGPGMKLYDHKEDASYECASLESSPAISLAELVNHRDAEGVDDLIDRLNRFENFAKNYPPLKIFALEDWPDDLCQFMAERALTTG